MTLSSWKKEFYRVEADAVPEEKALAHSIRKWTGLLKTNLKKHKLARQGYRLTDCNGKTFDVDSETCSLCEHYYDTMDDCAACPLAVVRGDIPCTRRRFDEDESPYDAFCYTSDARPMLRWLKRAQKGQKK